MKMVQRAKQSCVLKTNIILGDCLWWKLAQAINDDWQGLEKCSCQIAGLLVSGDVFAKQRERCREIIFCVLLLCPNLNSESSVVWVLPGFSAHVFIYSGQAFVQKTNQKVKLVPEWLAFPGSFSTSPTFWGTAPSSLSQCCQALPRLHAHSSALAARGWWHWIFLGREKLMHAKSAQSTFPVITAQTTRDFALQK